MLNLDRRDLSIRSPRVTHLEGKCAILVSSNCLFISVLTPSRTTELCFWLFVVKAGPMQKDWFSSLYFKMWMIGSCIAVLYMPFVTFFTRDDPLKVRYCIPCGIRPPQKHILTVITLLQSEAYTFLAGSLGSLSITLWFLPVL